MHDTFLEETSWGMLKVKSGEPHYIKVFGSKKTKGSKQDYQNRLKLPMPEEGEY
jgi:hypothetical protein